MAGDINYWDGYWSDAFGWRPNSNPNWGNYNPYGQPTPSSLDIRIEVEKYVCSPEGKAEIARLAREMMSNSLEDEIKRLIADGLMTSSGVPIVNTCPASTDTDCSHD